VSVFGALEAKIFATLADDISLNHRWVDYSVGAAGSSTVLSLLVLMYKRFLVVLFVSLEFLMIQELFENFIGNNQLARCNRTNAQNNAWTSRK